MLTSSVPNRCFERTVPRPLPNAIEPRSPSERPGPRRSSLAFGALFTSECWWPGELGLNGRWPRGQCLPSRSCHPSPFERYDKATVQRERAVSVRAIAEAAQRLSASHRGCHSHRCGRAAAMSATQRGFRGSRCGRAAASGAGPRNRQGGRPRRVRGTSGGSQRCGARGSKRHPRRWVASLGRSKRAESPWVRALRVPERCLSRRSSVVGGTRWHPGHLGPGGAGLPTRRLSAVGRALIGEPSRREPAGRWALSSGPRGHFQALPMRIIV